jgi:hypothetical protein
VAACSGRSSRGQRRALGEAVEVDGMLRGRRRWRAPGEAVEGEAIEWHRVRSGRGDNVLRVLAASKT